MAFPTSPFSHLAPLHLIMSKHKREKCLKMFWLWSNPPSPYFFIKYPNSTRKVPKQVGLESLYLYKYVWIFLVNIVIFCVGKKTISSKWLRGLQNTSIAKILLKRQQQKHGRRLHTTNCTLLNAAHSTILHNAHCTLHTAHCTFTMHTTSHCPSLSIR